MSSSRSWRLALIASLYLAQAVPMGFLLVAMPVILRRAGYALETVGLFSAIALPWLLKFAWAPWLDRWGARRGHFLSWIVPLQSLSAITVVSMAFFDIESDLSVITILAAAFMLLSATQDIATDGLAVRVLGADERGHGNGFQVGGYYLGHVLGGGGVLAIYGLAGWAPAVFAMATILALPLLLTRGFEEPAVARPRRVDYHSMLRLMQRSGIVWIVGLMLFRAGEGMATFVFNQLLVERLGLVDIGLISGGLYALGAVSGALIGGSVVGRLGRRRAMVGFGLLQAVAIGLYALPVLGLESVVWLYLAPVIVGGAGGLATAALYTAMMDHADPHHGASDFTLQQALAAFGPLVGTMASGFSAGQWGFAGHFLVCAMVAGLAAGLMSRARLAEVG